MRLAAVLVCALLSVAASAIAHAAPPGETAPFAPIVIRAPEPARIEGYRGHLAVADLAGAATIAIGVAADSDALTAIGVVGAFTLAPAAHLLAHNPEHSVLSLGLRLGMPIAGALAGAGLGAATDDATAGSLVGLAAGAAGAVVLDYAVLARRRVPARAGDWTPTATAGRGTVALGIAARF